MTEERMQNGDGSKNQTELQGGSGISKSDAATDGKGKKTGDVIAVVLAVVLGLVVGAGGTLFVTRNVWNGKDKETVAQAEKEDGNAEETALGSVLTEETGEADGESDAAGIEEKITEIMSLADACMEEGAYEDAQAYYRDVLEQDVSFAQAYQKLSEIYLLMGNYADAVSILTEGMEKSQSADVEALRGQLMNVYLQEADVSLEAGNYEEALTYCRNILEQDVSFAQAYQKRSEIYLLMGDYADAVSILAEGMEKSQSADTEALHRLLVDVCLQVADVWLAAGDYTQALTMLREGIDYTGDAALLEREQAVRDRIKVVKETWYSPDDCVDGWIEYEYDVNGNLLSAINCDSDGLGYGGSSYEYNAFGNVVRWYSLLHTSNGEYVYDANGNRIKEIRYDEDRVDSWTEYEYDANGNQIKEISYYSDGSVSGWHEYEYDANGDLTKDADYFIPPYYNSDGSAGEWVVYEYEYEYVYDANGNLIEEVSSGPKGTSSTRYEYDINRNLIKEVRYGSDGYAGSRTEYEYAYIGE